jgi:neutral ceramidase
MVHELEAGAAAVDITPLNAQFLCGYPQVERYSTGVHDPLWSSALYLSDGCTPVLFVANDIVFVGKDLVQRARQRIHQATGVPAENIMITATHTHSGPLTVAYLSNAADPAPPPDPAYLRLLEDGVVQAAQLACQRAQPAQAGLALADATGIGTNRRDPRGPALLHVPVLVFQSVRTHEYLACMLVCAMHPTVLHEDSTLVSGDFPGLARQYLQRNILGENCPVLHHTGPCGNQSPRHVTQANTFAEAGRLGRILGQAAAHVIPGVNFHRELEVRVRQAPVCLPAKDFPGIEEAQSRQALARQRWERLRAQGATRQETRTAECDWFGAEQTLTVARAARDGRLEQARQSCLPAEIQVVRIGRWAFVAWPGEVFVEYALQITQQFANTYVISLANGELQGYIVTESAAQEGGYEASNALFSYRSGAVLVERTAELLRKLQG